MRPVGLKQQSKQIESYCDSRQQTATATATATNTEAEPAAKQFVSPPSNLSSKANVLQFVNKKISLRFLRLLGPVCSRSVFASPPPDTCLHCLCCCFVCCLHVIGYLSVSVAAPVLVCFPLSLFHFLSGSCFANENCTRMLPK